MTTSPAGEQFLDPAVLARVSNLELVARTVVEGFLSGLHRSPMIGSSTDFSDHRPYVPGDDIRRIDWRVFARSERFYIKRYEAETNTNFVALLDVSKSMRYGRKLEYGCIMAACLAYLASVQRDRVGMATFASEIEDYVRPSARHLRQTLHALDRASRNATDGTPAAERRLMDVASKALPFEQLADPMRKRSMVVVISDLYEEPEKVAAALDFVRGRGNDIAVFHVLDPREIDFPFTDPGSFVDSESGERMPVIPDYLRDEYRRIIREHSATLQRVLGERRVEYALFNTGQPLDAALHAYLAVRKTFGRRRR